MPRKKPTIAGLTREVKRLEGVCADRLQVTINDRDQIRALKDRMEKQQDRLSGVKRELQHARETIARRDVTIARQAGELNIYERLVFAGPETKEASDHD